MSWWWVYVIIAAAFVAMLIGYAVWLWHKASDVYAEVQVLGRRAGQLADVLARLDLRPLERPAGRPEDALVGRRHSDAPAAWDADLEDDDWTEWDRDTAPWRGDD